MPHIPDNHADHDRLLVAAFAAGDATGAELDRAMAMVATCPDCAALHHDLRAITAALPDLPSPARPRDFRLTPEQAATLHPAGWRRWLAPLAGPRFSFAAPLGTGLATLGIAGLLLAGSLGAPAAADLAGGGTAATTQPESMAAEAPAEAPVAGEAEGGAVEDGATNAFEGTSESRVSTDESGDVEPQAGAGATFAPDGALTAPEAQPVEPGASADSGWKAVVPASTPAGTPERQVLVGDDGTGPAAGAMLPALSGLALLAGLALLVLRFAGRRLGA